MSKITNFFKKNWHLFFFTLLAFISRFLYFSKQNEIVFDEIYFGNFTINYFSQTNFFDIHPPFGKLLLFFFAKIFNFNYLENQNSQILLTDPKNLFILRLLPAIFGILIIPIIFKLTEILSNSKKTAALAAFFIIFDNAFLVYSRLALLDIILVFFGILTLWFFFLTINLQKITTKNLLLHRSKYKTTKKLLYLILSATFAGTTISIKWTGLSILGIIYIILIWKLVKRTLRFKKFLLNFLTFLIIPSLFYLGNFALHFSLIKKSGPDDAFFSPAYLRNLEGYLGPKNVKPANFFEKFKELNKIMYTSNRDLKATHPYSSFFWQWPFSKKAIYLWQGKNIDNKTANLWLFGNLIIWLASFVTIIFILFTILLSFFKILKTSFFNFIRKKTNKLTLLNQTSLVVSQKLKTFPNSLSQKIKNTKIYYFLLLAYFINLIPFIFIKRVLFLYHYFFAIIFAIIALASLLNDILILYPKYKMAIYLIIIFVIIFFLVFSPLSYGFYEPQWLYNLQLKIIFNY